VRQEREQTNVILPSLLALRNNVWQPFENARCDMGEVTITCLIAGFIQNKILVSDWFSHTCLSHDPDAIT